MEINDYIKAKNKIRKFVKDEKVNKAIEILDDLLLKSQTDTTLIISKACLIQIAEDCKYTLKDSKELLKLAIKIDPNNIDALLELAYYFYVIEDSSSKTFPAIEKALDKCLYFLEELIELKLKCLVYFEREREISNSIKDLKLKVNKILKRASKKAKD